MRHPDLCLGSVLWAASTARPIARKTFFVGYSRPDIQAIIVKDLKNIIVAQIKRELEMKVLSPFPVSQVHDFVLVRLG